MSIPKVSAARPTEEQSRRAIERLMNDYCYLIDSGDIDAFSALFAGGHWGVIGEPGGPAVGAAAVAERLQAVILYEDGTPRTKHLMSNVDIEVESETRATARCCIMVMQAVVPELPLQAIFIGRYDDVFECVDGEWRFLSRDIHPDLIGRMDFHRSDMGRASD
jgi:hypothetical protein